MNFNTSAEIMRPFSQAGLIRFSFSLYYMFATIVVCVTLWLTGVCPLPEIKCFRHFNVWVYSYRGSDRTDICNYLKLNKLLLLLLLLLLNCWPFVLYCIVLMGWSLLPNALRSFKIYCASLN